MIDPPAGWTSVPLRKLVQATRPRVDPKEADGLPFVGMDHVESQTMRLLGTVPASTMKSAAVQFEPGDVMYGRLRPYLNKVYRPNFRGLGSAEFIVLTPSERLDGDYLRYLLNSADFVRFATSLNTGDRPRVDLKQIGEFLVSLPSLDEQRRIVDAVERFLARIERAVETTAAMEPAIDAYRRALLLWAVTGRLGNADGQIEPEGIVAHPKEPDGGLPAGWTWATWGELGSSQNGRAFPSKEYVDSGVRLLRPGNLHASGRLSWTPKNTRHLPSHWAEKAPALLVGSGELVMNLTAQSLSDDFLGRVCLTGPDDAALLNQRLARLKPKTMSSRYLLWVFKSPLFRRFVRSLNTGSLIQHMFTYQLDEFRIPIPPPAEQEQIADELDRRMSVLQDLERTLVDSQARARALRKSVLGQALSGQLTSEPLS